MLRILKIHRAVRCNDHRARKFSAAAACRLPLTAFSDEENVFRESVAKFAERELRPRIKTMEERARFDPNLIAKAFEQGLMGIEVPAKYGGSEGTFMNMATAIEEISSVYSSFAPFVHVQNRLVNTLFLNAAHEEHKAHYLPQLCKDKVGAFALTEPEAGSDAFALKTVARADGDDYLLNGSKQFITNADVADIFLVMANAQPELKHKGITCFIVSRNTPGLRVQPPEKKLGICASGTCGLQFDDVRVHKSQILGEIGKGYQYVVQSLIEGRIIVGMQMIGVARGTLDATIPYTLQRKQFGQPIYNFQGVQHQIARTMMHLEAARMLTYNAVRLVEHGMPYAKEAAMTKVFTAEMAQAATINCIDWMGGAGYIKDNPQERFYRDVKIGAIYEGTSNVQLNVIAAALQKEYTR